MILSGLIVLCFIIYHLLHFTAQVTNPEFQHLHDASGRHDVYAMVIFGFSNIWVTLSYVVAQLILGVHLSHGISSMFH